MRPPAFQARSPVASPYVPYCILLCSNCVLPIAGLHPLLCFHLFLFIFLYLFSILYFLSQNQLIIIMPKNQHKFACEFIDNYFFLFVIRYNKKILQNEQEKILKEDRRPSVKHETSNIRRVLLISSLSLLFAHIEDNVYFKFGGVYQFVSLYLLVCVIFKKKKN